VGGTARQAARLGPLLCVTVTAAVIPPQPLLALPATEVGTRVQVQPHNTVSLDLGTPLDGVKAGPSPGVVLHGASPNAMQRVACREQCAQ
jgi:hypothetical protein